MIIVILPYYLQDFLTLKCQVLFIQLSFLTTTSILQNKKLRLIKVKELTHNHQLGGGGLEWRPLLGKLRTTGTASP